MGLLDAPWRAAPAGVDEARYLLADPFVGALNVALAKARSVETSDDNEVILAADTLVVVDGEVLGKPADGYAARRMLLRLSGGQHQVLTGVALRTANAQQWGGVVSTRVRMRDLTETEIDAYIGRGEPFDKAGGYAIQDTALRPVEAVDGCYLNVVGLPLCAVAAGLAALGINVKTRADRVPPCEYCRLGEDVVAVRSVF